MRNEKIGRFARYGLIGGVAPGLFSGFIVSGPHFHAWSASASLSVILGSAALGAFIGYMALAIIVSSLVRGGIPDSSASGGSNGSSQDLNVIAHDNHATLHHSDLHSHGDTSHVSHD
jgi:hypothetical protein